MCDDSTVGTLRLTEPHGNVTHPLQALFRPVAMTVPDYSLVAEVILLSEGFDQAGALSNKVVQLYKLASEQLSQQVRLLLQDSPAAAVATHPGPGAEVCVWLACHNIC